MDGREAAAYRQGRGAREKGFPDANPYRIGQQSQYDAWARGYADGVEGRNFAPGPPDPAVCGHGRQTRYCPICQAEYLAAHPGE